MVDIAKLGIEIDSKGSVKRTTDELRSLEQQSGKTERATDRLGKETNKLGKEADKTSRETKKAREEVDRFGRESQETERKTGGLTAGLGRLAAGIGAAALAYRGLTGAFRASEDLTRAQNSLRILGLTTEEAANQYGRLANLARDTRAPLESITQLYSRLSLSATELGASQSEIERATKNVGLALAQTGGSAASSSGALLQLSQAFGAGIVRAEEFNSILEGALPIAQAAARGIDEAGGSVSKLRQLVIDGKVSSDEFFQALLSQSDELEDAFSRTVPTISQGFSVLKQEVGLFSAQALQASGALDLLGAEFVNTGNIIAEFRKALFQPEEIARGAQILALSDEINKLENIIANNNTNDPRARRRLEQAKQRIDAAKEEYNALLDVNVAVENNNKLLDQADSKYRSLLREIDPTIEANEKLSSGMKTLNEALKTGAINQAEYERAVRLLRESIEGLAEANDRVNATGSDVIGVVRKSRLEVDSMARAALAASSDLGNLARSFDKASISAAQFGQIASSSISNVFTALAAAGDVAGSLQALGGQIPNTLVSQGLSQAFDPSSGVGFRDLLSGGGGNLSGAGYAIDSFLNPLPAGQFGPQAPGFFTQAGSGFNFASSIAGVGGQLLGSAIFGDGVGTSIGGQIGSIAGTAIATGFSSIATALGPFAGPAGAVVGALLGSALGSLFGNDKPSNKEGNSILDLTSGGLSVGGQEGKKFSQENRDAAAAITSSLAGIASVLEDASGAALSGSVRVGIGNRDGLYAEFGNGANNTEFGFGNETRQFFSQDDAGVADLVSFVAQDMADQLGDSLPEAIRTAIGNIDFTSDTALQDLGFAAAFEDLFGLNAETLGQAEGAMIALTNQFNQFSATAERLGLDVADVESQFDQAATKLREDVIQGIEDSILSILDPTALAVKNLATEFAAARTDLEAAGIDTNALNRLEALRREQLIRPGLESDLIGAVDFQRGQINGRIGDAGQQRSALTSQIAVASRVQDFLTEGLRVAERLRSTYRDILSQNEDIAELQRQQAQEELRAMLGTGRLDSARIDRILPALTANAENQFATAFELRRDQAITAGLLATLADQEEKLAREAQQKEEARAARETSLLQEQINALDNQIKLEQASLLALDGILSGFGLLNDNVMSVESAVLALQLAIGGFDGTANQGGPMGAAAGGGGSFSLGLNATTNRALLDAIPGLESTLAPFGGFGTGGFQVAYSQFTDAQRAIADSIIASTPGFADGGMHAGGLRVVGERGPEIEATGPSRIYSASETANIMGGGAATANEVRAMRVELAALMRQISLNTAKSYKQLDRWDQIGLPEERDVSA